MYIFTLPFNIAYMQSFYLALKSPQKKSFKTIEGGQKRCLLTRGDQKKLTNY